MNNKENHATITDDDIAYVPIILCLVANDGLVSEFNGIARKDYPDLYKIYDQMLCLNNSGQVYSAFLKEVGKQTFDITKKVVKEIDLESVYRNFEKACDFFLGKSFIADFLYNGKRALSLIRKNKALAKSLPMLAAIGIITQSGVVLTNHRKLRTLKEYFSEYTIKESGYHINKTVGLFSDPKPVIRVENELKNWIYVDYQLDGRIFLCSEFLNGQDCIEILRMFGASSPNWFAYSESVVHGISMASELVKYVVRNRAHDRFKKYCSKFGILDISTI